MAACLLAAWSPAGTAQAAGSLSFGAGAWSWFGGPRALYYGGATYAGWLAPSGELFVASWDGRQRVRTVLPGYHPPDDHAAPSIAVLGDGRLMLLSSNHNGRTMDTRVSSRPGDVTVWRQSRSLGTNTRGGHGYTYPNAVTLRGARRPLYLFWRGADWLPAYSRYLGGGRWTRARHLLRGAGHSRYLRPYVKYATNGRAIAVAFSDTHPRNGRPGLRYALLRNRTFFSATGRRLTRPGGVLDVRKADVIRRPGRRTWLQDVALSPSGRPVVVWAAFPRPRSNHVYYYSTVSRGRWQTHRITSAGGPIGAVNHPVNGFRSTELYYSGGISLHPNAPSVVYLSRQHGRRRWIERWVTHSLGRRWRRRSVSGATRAPAMRPVVPTGLPGRGRQALWMSGTYVHFRTFRTEIRLAPVGIEPPTAVFGVRTAGSGSRAVHFDPSGTHGGGSRVVSAAWEFGDGARAPANGPVRHEYTGAGSYFARLVVTDARGVRDTFVREVIVR